MAQAESAVDRDLAPEFTLVLFPDGRMREADFNMKRILGWKQEQIFGLPWSNLLPVEGQNRTDLLFEGKRDLDGLMLPKVPFRVASGQGYINFDVQVTMLEGAKGYRLDVFKPEIGSGSADTAEKPVDKDTFFAFVDGVLAGPGAGAAEMKLVEVGAVANGVGGAAFKAEVEATLAKSAVGGKIGKLDEGAYAFLADNKIDDQALQAEIAEAAEKLDINASSLGFRTAGMALDARDVDSETLKRALNHARGVFMGEIEGRDDFTLQDTINGIEHHRRLISRALEAFKFMSVAREVRDGRSNTQFAILYEPKIKVDNQIRRADELIVLRDHPDLAIQHDLTILSEFLRVRVAQDGFHHNVPAFFELCAINLSNAGFVDEIANILEGHGIGSDALGFRVRNLPPARAGGPAWSGFDALSALRFRMWTDRFPDVVTDKAILERMARGLVEVSARQLDRVAAHPEGKALILRLIDIWRGKDVTVISADLETFERKQLASDVGIFISLADSNKGTTDRRQRSA